MQFGEILQIETVSEQLPAELIRLGQSRFTRPGKKGVKRVLILL